MRKVFWVLGVVAFFVFYLVTIPFGFVIHLLVDGFNRGWEFESELGDWLDEEVAR